jgi:hypothetical protein
VGGANPRGNQHIAQVSIALICNKGGKGKNAIEGGVLLQKNYSFGKKIKIKVSGPKHTGDLKSNL